MLPLIAIASKCRLKTAILVLVIAVLTPQLLAKRHPTAHSYIGYEDYYADEDDNAAQQRMKSSAVYRSNSQIQNEQTDESSSSVIPWRQINFVSPNQQLSQSRWRYEVPISFSAKGMDHLYLLNEMFLEWLQPSGLPAAIIKKDLFENPEAVVKQHKVKVCDFDAFFSFTQFSNSGSNLLSHFWGMILTSTVALCFAVIVPLFGFLLCCCCCTTSSRAKANRNGRDSPLYANTTGESPRQHERRKKKKPKYKVEKGCDSFCRTFCAANLFVMLLLITFFVICAFVTNEYIRNGLRELPNTLNQSLDDFKLYLNNTQLEVKTLLRDNFLQLQQELDDSLDKSGQIVKNRLAFVSHASALENLTEIVTSKLHFSDILMHNIFPSVFPELDTIKSDLKHLSDEMNELGGHLHLLQLGLHQTKQKLEVVFKDCKHPICAELERKFRGLKSKFRVSTRLDDLPNLKPLMDNITDLLNADIVHEVQKGKDDFDRIGTKIQSAVNSSIPNIKDKIREVGRELASTLRDVNEALRTPFTDIKKAKESVNTGDEYIEEYEIYRWYSCLAGAGAVLLILALYTCGLMCGVCKRQPTIHDYRSRRVKPPSTCALRCGIVLLFLFFGVLLICTIALFIVGGISDRVGCYYIEHPEDPLARKLAAVVQNLFDEQEMSQTMRVIRKDGGTKPNFAEIVARCHHNMSLYNSLQLYKYNHIQLTADKMITGFNVSGILELKERYQIEERLESFLAQVNVNPGPIVILTNQGRELLHRLRDTSLGTLNFSLFAELVHQQVTPLNLIEVSNELEREAKRLPPSQLNASSELKNIALMLDMYQSRIVAKIHDSVVRLKSGAEKIERKAQYGQKGLKEALNELLEKAKKAQHYIRNNGREVIRDVARAFVADLSSLIDQYSQHVVSQVENNIGRCEPNGFWLSMASALFLLLPASICAAVLSNLFRKLKRGKGRRHYSGDSYVRREYAMETLEDDDIPLAQVSNKDSTTNTMFDVRRPPNTSLYLDSTSSAPSAPMVTNDDNWSPGAPPPHIYARPPPYNFAN
ncbi:prominin-like protein [Leptotrombidium deliense]|uniref:Prominin-like protein n=1 Tax=Leptotrombidium deliense TaxID=299467 RepID=A0A443SGY4_9ACAR|nr:prominin-like protein [Leptotrombidium deliense]